MALIILTFMIVLSIYSSSAVWNPVHYCDGDPSLEPGRFKFFPNFWSALFVILWNTALIHWSPNPSTRASTFLSFSSRARKGFHTKVLLQLVNCCRNQCRKGVMSCHFECFDKIYFMCDPPSVCWHLGWWAASPTWQWQIAIKNHILFIHGDQLQFTPPLLSVQSQIKFCFQINMSWPISCQRILLNVNISTKKL